MTQAFNPFQPPPAAAPVPPAAAPAAAVQTPTAQRAIPQGLGDASQNDGFSTPFLPHLDGVWGIKVTGYVGTRTPKLGIACHITFEVLTSSTPDRIPVGSTWRIAYKYDFERQAKADLDTYGSDARQLSHFVEALYSAKHGVNGFDVVAAEAALRKHDFTAQPGFVQLMGRLGKEKVRTAPTGGQEKRRWRDDFWSPATAPKAA
jgi:hypothetical protein